LFSPLCSSLRPGAALAPSFPPVSHGLLPRWLAHSPSTLIHVLNGTLIFLDCLCLRFDCFS
ncbi:unnamed protein product, partial [Musa hybrid cultivar]